MKKRTPAFFAVTTGIIVLIAILIATAYHVEYQNALSTIVNDAVRMNVKLVHDAIAASGLQKALTGAGDERNAAIRSSLASLDGYGYLHIKVWNESRQIVGANTPSIVGATFVGDEELERAFQGETVYSIADLDDTDDGENFSERNFADLLELYIPIRGDDGIVTMVAEVYVPYDPMRDAARSRALGKLIPQSLVP